MYIEECLHEINEKLNHLETLLMEKEEMAPLGEERLNTEEAAKFLKTDRNTLCRWTREGKIPHDKISRRIYFKMSELEEWMRKGGV